MRRVLVFATRDDHPPNHCSFHGEGGPWPPHCVHGTHGAQFHPQLRLPKIFTEIFKATRPEKEAYSDFEETGLARELRKMHITHLYVGGLATDYCVLATVLDGMREGFAVTVLTDAIRAVNVRPKDGAEALAKMASAGAKFQQSTDVVTLKPNSALMVIDVQNDFCSGGTLAVSDGDAVIPPLNAFMERFA